MFRSRHRFIVPVLSLLAFLPASASHAAGQWNGQDLLHVPISWCIVQGSPAEANPNVAGDTTTDALIWRRHERPTDNIYINQTGISFRSAINDVWGSLSFPIIPDPDTTLGVPGDMRGEDVNVFGAEFNQMQNDCDVAWANLGRAGIGITAVNAGLFHDGAGNYVGTIGWGGCVQNVGNPGVCVTPFDGLVTVIDNHYLFPTVPDRTFPDGSGNQFILTDPFDALTGHEFGHALSLPHRSNVTALMNPGMVDNNADNQTDNIGLNNTEVNALRAAAMIVNGLEIDPPNVFLPGDVVAANLPDPKRNPAIPAHHDLSALRATIDTKTDTFSLGQRLFGLVPEAAGQRHWFLIDNDGPARGATADQLRELGVPEADFVGADVVIRADLSGPRVSGGEGWQIVDGRPTVVTPSLKLDLLALVMHPHFADLKLPRPQMADREVPVHHIVSVSMPRQLAGVSRGQTFNVDVLVENAEARAADRLDAKETGRGTAVNLDFPSFPHCYPQADVPPGETVKINFDGLTPNRGYHALLGARMVGRGIADLNGTGTFEMTIPKDTTPGLHLVTIGTDLTALTADCTVTVMGEAQK